MRNLMACYVIVSVAACAPNARELATGAAAVDSIVLERTPCYGTCPAYRLSIARDGVVRFQSRNRNDSTAATDTLRGNVLALLAERAMRIPLASLPDTIASDRVLCQVQATDHPTIIIGMFGTSSKQVVYYTGCYMRCCEHPPAPPLEELASLASAIDSAAGAARWIRPGRMR